MPSLPGVLFRERVLITEEHSSRVIVLSSKALSSSVSLSALAYRVFHEDFSPIIRTNSPLSTLPRVIPEQN